MRKYSINRLNEKIEKIHNLNICYTIFKNKIRILKILNICNEKVTEIKFLQHTLVFTTKLQIIFQADFKIKIFLRK